MPEVYFFKRLIRIRIIISALQIIEPCLVVVDITTVAQRIVGNGRIVGVADAVVNIFAPCAEGEYSRVLKDGGYLFVVGAGSEHLMGLKRAIYDNVYENGERADLPVSMERVDTVISRHDIVVEGREDIDALFSMTPYYWRTSEADREKLSRLSRLETAIEFEINVYRK